MPNRRSHRAVGLHSWTSLARCGLLAACFPFVSTQACSRCTTADMQGTFSADTFVPDSGCYHAVPTVDDTFALLSGRWLFTCGASNTWAVQNALLKQLDPASFPWRDERYNGQTTVWPGFADQIWERRSDGTYALVHSAYVCPVGGPCDAGSSEWHVQYDDLASVQTAASIPTFTERHVRVTFALGRLLPDCNEQLEYVRSAASGWSNAPKLVYIQSAIWYLNEELGVPASAFGPDLRSFLSNQRDICSVCRHGVMRLATPFRAFPTSN